MNHWFQDTINNTKERQDKTKARYRNNYNVCLQGHAEVIHEDDYLYLRVDRKNSKYHRRTLIAIAEGPYNVTKVDISTVGIEKDGRVRRKRIKIEILTHYEAGNEEKS